MSVSVLTSIHQPEETPTCGFCGEPFAGNDVWACLLTETELCDSSWGDDRSKNEYDVKEGDVLVMLDWKDEVYICIPCMKYIRNNLVRLAYPRREEQN